MHCYRCEEEYPPHARFCGRCGGPLAERPIEQTEADLARVRFLLGELEKWKRERLLPAASALEIEEPYRLRARYLEQVLEHARKPAGSTASPASAPAADAMEPAPAKAAPVDAPSSATLPVTDETLIPAELAPLYPAEILVFPAQPAEPGAIQAAGTEPEASPAPAKAPAAGEPRAADLAIESAAALAAALADPLEVSEPRPTPEQELIERESPWSSFWRPFLYENIGWFVGAVLLLSGSFYFVAESEGLVRTLLVSGLLAVYSTGFWWLGRYLARARGLVLAGRVLASIAAAMTPMAILALAPLHGPRPGLWALVTLIATGAMALLARGCAAVFGDESRDRLGAAAAGMLLLFALVPLSRAELLLAVLDAAGLAVLWLSTPLLSRLRADRGHATFAGAGLGWLALALFLRVHYQGPHLGAACYGPLAALLALLVCDAERHLFPDRQKPSWLAIVGCAAFLPAALFSSASRLSLAIACLVGAVGLARSALRYRSGSFTLLALGSGWIAFYAASGFFRIEWLLALSDGIKSAAGYEPSQRLPFNYGGLASLIYLAALPFIYRQARRSSADWALRAFRRFGLGLALVLLVWGHLGDDLRPAALTALAIAALALVCSIKLEHPRLAYLAAAALLITGIDAGLSIRLAASAAAIGLAAATVLVLALSLRLEAERRQAFVELAVVGAAGAVLLAPFAGAGLDAAAAYGAAGIAALLAGLAASTSLLAYPALAYAVAAPLLAIEALELPEEAIPWTAVGIGLLFVLLAGFEKKPRRAVEPVHCLGIELPLAASGWDVLREPLSRVGQLASWAGIAAAFEFDPVWSPLLLTAFAAVSLLAARRASSAWQLHPASLALAVALAWESSNLWGERTIGLAFAAAAFGLAAAAVLLQRVEMLSQRVLRLEPARASKPLMVCSALVTGLAVLAIVATPIARPSLELTACAAAILLLVRCRGQSGWLYPGATLLTLALALLVPTRFAPALVAAAALACLGLILLSRRAPRLAALLIGTERLEPALVRIAHLHALAALIVSVAVSFGRVELQQLAPTFALLAVFYALAPRVSGWPVWWAASTIAAWAAAALAFSSDLLLLLLASVGALAVLFGAVIRAWPERSRPVVFAEPARVATTFGATGLAMASLAALAAISNWPVEHGGAVAGAASLAFALAPRVFPSALFLCPSAALGMLAALQPLSSSERPLAAAVGAVALTAIAVLTRRFSAFSRIAFGLSGEPAKLGPPTLAVSGLCAVLVVPALLVAGPGFAFGAGLAATTGLAALACVLAFVATGWSPLVAAASAAFVAALVFATHRLEHAFLAGALGVNALLWLCSPKRMEAQLDWLERIGFAQPSEPEARAQPRSWVLGTAVAGATVGLVVLGLISFGRWIAFALGLDPTLCLLMIGAQALTAAHQLRRWPSLASWHMALVLLACALWLIGGRELWPYLATTAALLLAILEAGLERASWQRALELVGIPPAGPARRALASTFFGYGLALCALGLLATEGAPGSLATPVSLAIASLAFAVRAAGGSRFAGGALVALVPATLHFALFYAGVKLSTGRPAETILPFLALATAVPALIAQQLASRLAGRPSGRTANVAANLWAALAALEWLAGLSLARFEAGELIASSLAIAALSTFHLLRARRTGSAFSAYAGLAGLVAFYLCLRVQTDWLGPEAERSDADALAGLVFGFVFLGLGAALKRLGLEVLEKPARRLALLAPLAASLLLEHEASLVNALLLFGIAVELAALSAVEGRGKVAGLLAAVAFNAALALLWIRAGLREAFDAQFFAIPAGVTLVLLARIYRDSIGEAWQGRLRSVGVLGIYLSSIYPALTSFSQPSYVLWCALLCVIGVAAGIALRVRVYLYLGTAFLVTCIGGNLARYGLQHHQAGAAFLTILGLLVVGFMIFFSARREELLRKYREVESLLSEWK